MRTASDKAPAAQASLGHGADDEVVLSVADVMERTGFGRQSILHAIEDDRLRASFEQRPYERGRRGARTHWVIRPADLDAWVSSLQRCGYAGCDRLGHSRLGACSGPHGKAIASRGKPRPEWVRERMREGIARADPRPKRGQVPAISEALARFWSSSQAMDESERRAARMARFWKTGEGAPPAVLKKKARGRTRMEYFGRWHGHKGAAGGIEAGRAKGGRKRQWGDDQDIKQVEILRLKEDGLSSREIAERVFGDRRLYKRVLRLLSA